MLRDDAHALSEAERLGYPVLIKPSAGGGGKGMRMVRTPRELESALKVCRSEAKAAFGDDSLYLERWLDENRHVEVQVAVDRFGHGVHIGERDCSVQRRHQKILEEAPTPALDLAARTELAERAVRAVVAAGYENMGTLEFLVDREGNAYFIEINCRIQVEHPVTEMLTGIDLVTTQIRIAAGEPLGFSQADVTFRGHVIEFRINAEDPEAEFRPGAGIVERYHAPGGPGVRMDSHLFSGLRGPAVLRLAPGQARGLGPGPGDRHRPRPRGARRARRRRPRDECRDPASPADERDVPRGAVHHEPPRPRGERGLPDRRRPDVTAAARDATGPVMRCRPAQTVAHATLGRGETDPRSPWRCP